jgi:hypothetical protein
MDRLMKGEDPETPYLEDARHWRDVYAELLNFKHDVIDLAENRVEDMSAPAAEEVVQTDATILEAERRRLQRRYDFWVDRCHSLQGQADAS